MELIGMLLVIVIPIATYFYVRFIINKYNVEDNLNELTGFDIARSLLDSENLNEVLIFETDDYLNAHYDPARKTVKLTPDVYKGNSISSTAIAGFEYGHASQDRANHQLYKLRVKISPVFKYTSNIGYLVLIVGFFTSLLEVYYLGLSLCAFGIIFHLVTLPVERDACKRSIEALKETRLIMPDEYERIETVSNAYSLIYIASLIGELIYMFKAAIEYFTKG